MTNITREDLVSDVKVVLDDIEAMLQQAASASVSQRISCPRACASSRAANSARDRSSVAERAPMRRNAFRGPAAIAAVGRPPSGARSTVR